MTTSRTPNTSVAWPQAIVNSVWPFLTGRRGMILLIAAAITAGLALNWGWFLALGVAPILIKVLPCLVMCGIGLCMNRATGRASCGGDKADRDKDTKRGPK